MHGTPLSVGSPQEVIEKTLTFQEGFGDYQRQLWVVDAMGLPVETGARTGRAARHRGRARAAQGDGGPPRARGAATRRPTPAWCEAKYGDAEPRQPRPNPNRGDNLTGTSPYQDSDRGRSPPSTRWSAERWPATPGSPTRRGRRCSARRRRSRASSTDGDVGGTRPARVRRALRPVDRPDGLRITELGEDVLLTQPGMSRLVARLEDAGLSSEPRTPTTPAPAESASPDGVRRQRQVGLPPTARHVAHGDDPQR